MAIAVRRIQKSQLREESGNFTIIRANALRVKLVPKPEISLEEGKALPIYCINNDPHFHIGEHLYLGVDGGDAIEVYEVGEEVPLTSFSLFPAYIENEKIETNINAENESGFTKKVRKGKVS